VSPLDLAAVRRSFSRAAPRYEASARLQREVERETLEQLVFAKRDPAWALDLGAGTGHASAAMRKRWPAAQVIACDQALPMLREAKRQAGWWRPFHRLGGDAHALPLSDQSLDLVFSNLCLQWCEDLPRVFDEFRRVLRPDGLLVFSTFGPGTLHELREAYAEVDRAPHVLDFPDMPVLGDALMAAGFRDPVLSIDSYTLHYPDARALMRELKAIGASNAHTGRARGLGGRERLGRVLDRYETHRTPKGVPATYEVITAMAFGPDASQPRRGRGGDMASVPLDSLRAQLRARRR